MSTQPPVTGARSAPPSSFVTIHWRGREVRIEHRFIEPAVARAQQPLTVFLHEGLGSLSLWKDYPQRLCDALGCRGLVYSRPGYGQSTPRDADETWDLDFMHRQAHEVLPAFLAELGIDAQAQPLRLFGHSDGGSIALLFAARFPAQVQELIVLAPHLFVEDVTIENIVLARKAYTEGQLRQGLAKHHDDPDSAFWGWNNIWLHPPFRDWNIEAEIGTISARILAVQGVDDEYGSLDQIHAIARHLPGTRCVALPDCGHSPHRDQPQALTAAVVDFCAGASA
jgi:pimeloyl-ACP methyl ester carboxylesterase